jgi:hypothetical protein
MVTNFLYAILIVVLEKLLQCLFRLLDRRSNYVWDIDVDAKDSWGWKCILNLRELVGNHMRYKIGDGKSINVWHDKWNSGTALSNIISKKEIFYAGFQDSSCITDVLNEHG